MIISWIIGLILSILGISFFKNSRIKETRTWGEIKPERTVLKLWSLSLFIIGAVIPIFNILMGIVMIIWWAISVYGDKEWIYTKQDSKIIKFLNKPIQ